MWLYTLGECMALWDEPIEDSVVINAYIYFICIDIQQVASMYGKKLSTLS